MRMSDGGDVLGATTRGRDGALLGVLLGVLLGALLLAVYLVLGQRTFHANDGPGFVYYLAHDQLSHALHFLYLPILGFVRDAFGWTGLDTVGLATLASALGTAIGVVWLHAAAAGLGCGRGDSLVVAAAVGLLPGVLFFATVVEVHGVYLAFAGLGWWCVSRAVPAPTPGRVVLVGCASALGASVHASGQLLAPLFAGFLVASWRDVPWRRRLAAGGAVLAVHAVAVFVIAAAVRPPGGGVVSQAGYFEQWLRPFQLAELARSVWNEWLWPFAPFSLLWLAAFRKPGLVPEALATAGPVLLGLTAAFVLIPMPADNPEHGAYLFGMAFPAVLLTVRSVARPLVLAAVAVGATVGVADVVRHDTWVVTQDDRVLGMTALERGWLLIAADDDQARSLLLVVPELDTFGVFDLSAQAHAAGAGPAGLAALFDALVARAKADGRPLWISDRALALWEDGPDELSRRFVAEHLRSRYRLERDAQADVAAWRVVPRS